MCPFLIGRGNPWWCYVLPLLIQGSDPVNVCVVNLSDIPVCLRRHTLLANAVEVDAMLDPYGTESGDGAQGPVVYMPGDDFDGHIDAELPSICRVRSSENGPEVQFFSAVSQTGWFTGHIGGCEGRAFSRFSEFRWQIAGRDMFANDGRAADSQGAEGCSSVPDEANDTQTRRLPAHLQSMYDDAATRLSEEQAARFHALLLVFADVFAACDLDIGEFSTLVHWIKTGTAFPSINGWDRLH